MTPEEAAEADHATQWLATIGEVIAENLPPPFTFVLAIFKPGDVEAIMLSPQPPKIVAPVLRELAKSIDKGDINVTARPGDLVKKPTVQ